MTQVNKKSRRMMRRTALVRGICPCGWSVLATQQRQQREYLYKEDATGLEKDDKFQQQVSQAMASRYEKKLSEDKSVEERIYGGFYSKNDQRLVQQFQYVRQTKFSWQI